MLSNSSEEKRLLLPEKRPVSLFKERDNCLKADNENMPALSANRFEFSNPFKKAFFQQYSWIFLFFSKHIQMDIKWTQMDIILGDPQSRWMIF